MNREIEFRAYIKNEKIMINVPIIDFRKNAECIRTVYGQTDASEWKYKFDDIILMQYTGLTDTNGKKIFEGDIVHYEDSAGLKYEITGTVVYTQNCMFEIEYYDEILKQKETRPLVCHEHPIFASKKIEIIGNIYEDNKEGGNSNE